MKILFVKMLNLKTSIMETNYNIHSNPSIQTPSISDNQTWHRQKFLFKFYLSILTCMIISNHQLFGQNSGDYRSLNNGDWATAGNWEVYNGSTWVTASTYPGQNAGSYAVNILAGDTISIPNTGLTTNEMGNLTISGTLVINGLTSSSVTASLNTPQIYITPWLTPVASIDFLNKCKLILPTDAIIRVWLNGLRGDCNNNEEIYIGSMVFAVCNGAPGSIFTFAELMQGGGTINSNITPADASICLGTTLSLTGSYTGAIANAPTFKWASTGPQALAFNPDSTSQNISVTPTLEGTYIVSLTATTVNEGVSYSNTERLTLTVNKKSADPTNATAASDTIMLSKSTTLSLNGGGGGTNETIRWYTSSCGGTLIGTGNNLSVNPIVTTTYYGRYENSAPCSYNSTCAQTTITVIPYANIWKGSISTDFGTAGNWMDNVVPSSGENITFDDSPDNDCILDLNRIAGNILNKSNKNLSTSSHNLTINGSIQFNGTGKIDATNTNGAIIFAGADSQTLPAFSFSGNTISNIDINAKAVNLNGDLTISKKITLSNGSLSIGTNTLTLNDSLKILSGSLVGGTTSNMVIAENGNNITIPSINLNNLTLNRTNGLTLGGALSINGTLALTNGTLSLGPNTITFAGSSPTITNGVIDATNGDSKVIFANTAAITLPINLFTGSINTLKMNGTGGISLQENISISKNLELFSGKIQTNASMIVIENSANMITGANTNSYINGTCRKIGNTAFTFEIGDSENYAPMGITDASGGGSSTDSFTANYYGYCSHPTYDSTQHESTIARISSMEYWTLNRAGTNEVSVQLSWDTRSGGVSLLSDLLVIRWDGSKWIDHGNSATTGNTLTGTVTSNPVSNFSPFTLGSLNEKTNYLPITLIDFTAKCIDHNALFNWSTASESNNNYFEIEQSVDAINWNSLAIIPGAGNSNELRHYSYTDELSTKTDHFYRLKSVDYDGTYYYSMIQFLNSCKVAGGELKLYPIPSKGIVFLSFLGEGEIDKIEIYNLMGEIIYSHDGFINKIDLSNQREGSYYVIAYYNGKRIIEKISILK